MKKLRLKVTDDPLVPLRDDEIAIVATVDGLRVVAPDGAVWPVGGGDRGPAGPVGPEGPAGPVGPGGPGGADGAEGPAGEAGPAGTAGATAYDVATANGYVGTEADWLASLHGPKGDPGDAAPAGGDKTFVHQQLAAQDVWVVAHNLGKLPAVTVIDSAQNQVIGDVTYLDLDHLEVRFSAAFSGAVTCN